MTILKTHDVLAFTRIFLGFPLIINWSHIKSEQFKTPTCISIHSLRDAGNL